MDAERGLDVVVFGATGFVGRLVAEYLAQHAPDGTRIGLAGRSEARLAEVRAGLGAVAAQWPLIVADSGDTESLTRLARSARVVATTVGPYLHRGLALVGACAEAGTDYVDLTGEVLFERASADRYHEVAAGSGARIVHGGGFDSIPSDLGVHTLYEAVKADGGGDLEGTTLAFTASYSVCTPRSDGIESNPPPCTIRAPDPAATSWYRSALARSNSTSPVRST